MDLKSQKMLIGLVAVLVLIVGFYMLKNRNKADAIPSNISTTTEKGITLQTNSSDYTVTEVPIENKKSVKIPDLYRKVVFGSGNTYSEEEKKMFTEKILDLQNKLKSDSKNLSLWIELGNYEKAIGDYDGAIMYWKYVSEVANKDFISFGNLANLYGYHLRNNGMAETYYRKAIENGPTQSYLYVQFSEFYRDVYKDLNKAIAVINEGLIRNPADPSLLEAMKNLELQLL
jgi:tetratricopeptide (TPR) repeat protein